VIFAFFAYGMAYISLFEDGTKSLHPLYNSAADGDSNLILEHSSHQLDDQVRPVVNNLKPSPKLAQSV
jgi:hypothetical protein